MFRQNMRACVGLKEAIVVLLCVVSLPASASIISVQIGDNDGYGVGIPDNGVLSILPVNEPDDPPFTDIVPPPEEEWTKQWHFTFDLDGREVLSATLIIDAGNIQDRDFGDIQLFLNGIEFVGAFDEVMHAPLHVSIPTATEVFHFGLTSSMLTTLQDNHATVEMTGFSDGVFIDFLRLDIEVVPEPGCLALLGIGVMLACRRAKPHRR